MQLQSISQCLGGGGTACHQHAVPVQSLLRQVLPMLQQVWTDEAAGLRACIVL